MAIAPIIINPVNDLTVDINASGTVLNLSNYFDDPSTTGLVARFGLYNTFLGNGAINVVLFDQANGGASLTVQNFRNYVNDGDYVNTIIHRSVPGFIIQGGGFKVEQLTPSAIPSDSPVQNEFSATRSNLRGTIAMAKLGGNPNSATNQWFFNLADNSGNLDNQNGGFTVFGQVLSNTDLTTIDAIAAVPFFNGSSLNPAFNQIPLLVDPNNPVIDSDNDFVRFSNITVSQVEELQFTVTGNSNPALVNPTINGRTLGLNYTPNQIGTAEITIAATTLLGERIEDTFTLTVLFDAAQYGASNPDLIGVYGYNLDAFQQHYINYGRAEGRSKDNFDEYRYIASNADLLNAFGANGAAATEHYISYGYGEGRSTTAFDSARYLLSNPDLLNAYGTNTQSASYHYVAYGSKPPENRDPNLFASDRYIASNSDLIEAFGYNLVAGSEHYLYRVYTGAESRPISFSPESYLALNSDVAAHPYFGQSLTHATQHYILYGFNERRSWA